MPRTLPVALAIAMLLLVGGCGGGGGSPPPPGSPSAAEHLVSPADLGKQPQGSPQRALLQWWMSIQYNDINGYLAGLTKPLREQREADGQAQRDLPLASSELARALPQFSSTRNANGVTTLFTRIETRQPVGATRFTTSSYPQAFTLVREGGEWKVADDSFVASRAAAIREALKATP